MSRTQSDVLAELLAISPQGDALPTQASDPGAIWPIWLSPLAAEIARFESFAEEMLIEVDPGTANYLLQDYERVLGPDPYGRDAGTLTIAQRQALALSRWTTKYGVRPQDFINLAASFGVVATVTEFQMTTVGGHIGDALVNNPTQYAWIFTMVGPNAETLLVAPVITGRAPAHTTPIVQYD